MKYFKHYLTEFLFIISFALPFLKTVTIADGVREVTIIYGFQLVIKYYYLVLLSIVFFVLFMRYKTAIYKYLCIIFYILFIVMAITFGDIVNVPLRDYLYFFTDILPNTYQIGLPIHLVLAFIEGWELMKVQ